MSDHQSVIFKALSASLSCEHIALHLSLASFNFCEALKTLCQSFKVTFLSLILYLKMLTFLGLCFTYQRLHISLGKWYFSPEMSTTSFLLTPSYVVVGQVLLIVCHGSDDARPPAVVLVPTNLWKRWEYFLQKPQGCFFFKFSCRRSRGGEPLTLWFWQVKVKTFFQTRPRTELIKVA